MLRLILCLGFVLFVVGMVAVDQYDKKMNYVAADARVIKVEKTCYLEKQEGNKRTTSEVLPCEQAEVLAQYHPAYAAFQVKYTIKVSYLFNSPVDQQAHEGKLDVSTRPEGKKLSSGDLMRVLVSKRDAAKSRSI